MNPCGVAPEQTCDERCRREQKRWPPERRRVHNLLVRSYAIVLTWDPTPTWPPNGTVNDLDAHMWLAAITPWHIHLVRTREEIVQLSECLPGGGLQAGIWTRNRSGSQAGECYLLLWGSKLLPGMARWPHNRIFRTGTSL